MAGLDAPTPKPIKRSLSNRVEKLERGIPSRGAEKQGQGSTESKASRPYSLNDWGTPSHEDAAGAAGRLMEMGDAAPDEGMIYYRAPMGTTTVGLQFRRIDGRILILSPSLGGYVDPQVLAGPQEV